MVAFDLSEFSRAASRLGDFERQIPFALAQTLNAAVTATRKELVEHTWPSHMTVRNRAFLGAALRREFARKTDLRAAVVESGPAAGRGNLSLHGRGGARQARRGNVAVPSETLKGRRTGKGVPKGMRPGALPNAFRKGDVLYQRVGKYQKGGKGARGTDNRHLKLVYTLKPSVAVKRDVPFQADFDDTMRRTARREFPLALQGAMRTAFRK